MASVFGYIGVETPAFTLLKRSPLGYEVRRYGKQLRCEVQTPSEEFTTSVGFRALANYIFGGNVSKENAQGSEKIAMTSPVVTSPSTKIAMTSPVVTTPSTTGATFMSFILPSKFTDLNQLPTPHDSSVRLIEVPEKTYAVSVFSGSPSEDQVQQEKEKLLSFLEKDEIKVRMGEAVQYCRYNPPWTISFFRTNEIMIPIEYE